ncbi:MAG: SCO family protein [Anaerolineales bacterium]|jgi:protein SCO1/2|nr:SCO family protein [Chloroflexota bacterium]MBK6645239.1 SCO family protein [Anaerolineales bacterium]MCC6984875.1 SCO family protein [Anaerolineales bacterium]
MDKKLAWVGGGILMVVAAAAALSLLFAKPPSFRGTLYAEPYPPAADFALTKADGTEFRLSDQKGRVVLLFFGYISCPDVCPTTLAEMKLVMEKLGDTSRDAQVVFVSVDPDRDTSEKMQAYVEHFNPSFLGVSGTIQELEPIWKDYSITREAVESDSAFGVIINHTARVFLVDPQGNMRLTFAYQTPVDDIVHDIRLILEQGQ